MPYDLNAAKAQLANLITGSYTPNDLLDLAKQVGVTADNTVTVIYNRA